MPPFLIYYDSMEMSKITKIISNGNLLPLINAPTKVAWPHITYNNNFVMILSWASYSIWSLHWGKW